MAHTDPQNTLELGASSRANDQRSSEKSSCGSLSATLHSKISTRTHLHRASNKDPKSSRSSSPASSRVRNRDGSNRDIVREALDKSLRTLQDDELFKISLMPKSEVKPNFGRPQGRPSRRRKSSMDSISRSSMATDNMRKSAAPKRNASTGSLGNRKNSEKHLYGDTHRIWNSILSTTINSGEAFKSARRKTEATTQNSLHLEVKTIASTGIQSPETPGSTPSGPPKNSQRSRDDQMKGLPQSMTTSTEIGMESLSDIEWERCGKSVTKFLAFQEDSRGSTSTGRSSIPGQKHVDRNRRSANTEKLSTERSQTQNKSPSKACRSPKRRGISCGSSSGKSLSDGKKFSGKANSANESKPNKIARSNSDTVAMTQGRKDCMVLVDPNGPNNYSIDEGVVPLRPAFDPADDPADLGPARKFPNSDCTGSTTTGTGKGNKRPKNAKFSPLRKSFSTGSRSKSNAALIFKRKVRASHNGFTPLLTDDAGSLCQTGVQHSSIMGRRFRNKNKNQRAEKPGNLPDFAPHRPDAVPGPSIVKSECIDNNGASSKATKATRFGVVHVREYERSIGDNPSVGSGTPVGLGWRYEEYLRVDVDVYESGVRKPGPRTRREYFLTPQKRFHMLLVEWGYPIAEICRAKDSAAEIRKSRRDFILGEQPRDGAFGAAATQGSSAAGTCTAPPSSATAAQNLTEKKLDGKLPNAKDRWDACPSTESAKSEAIPQVEAPRPRQLRDCSN